MTLPRLMHEGTAAERRLLRAARTDGPSSRLREQVLLSVSVGTLITMGTSTSQAALSSSSAPQSAAAMTGGLASGGIAVLVKWIGIAGVALMAGTSAGFAAGTAWADRTRADGMIHPLEPGVTVPGLAQNYEAVPVTVPPSSEPMAQAAATLPLPPPRVPGATVARTQRDTTSSALDVADEVHLIDEARVALRTGDASRCLRLTAERRQRFPNGVLSPEAALLRIEALTLSGQSELAQREGHRFLLQYPTGPLSGRVRVLLGRQAPGTSADSEVGTEAM